MFTVNPIKDILEVFARTIAGISTKSESESVSVENSAKSDIGPFCANNWGRFGEEVEVDLPSLIADCLLYLEKGNPFRIKPQSDWILGFYCFHCSTA